MSVFARSRSSERALRDFEPTMRAELNASLRQLLDVTVAGPVAMSLLGGRLTTDLAGQFGLGESLGNPDQADKL